jgi:ABC-type spermidine/putrescine transport system permease subunit I
LDEALSPAVAWGVGSAFVLILLAILVALVAAIVIDWKRDRE